MVKDRNKIRAQAKEARLVRKAREWSKFLVVHVKNNSCTRKSRGRICIVDIDQSDIEKIYQEQNGICFFSGVALNVTNPWSLEYPSVDRLDSSKGYVFDNCVLVCTWVNFAKNKWGAGVFFDSLQKVNVENAPARSKL